jgi:hypothetical protein
MKQGGVVLVDVHPKDNNSKDYATTDPFIIDTTLVPALGCRRGKKRQKEDAF